MTHLTKNKNFPRVDFGPLPDGLTSRELSEEEVARDLEKTNEQLLADAHEELKKGDMVHAQKRITSIMVRVATSNEKAAQVLIRLTWVLVVLTLVIVCLTVVVIIKG